MQKISEAGALKDLLETKQAVPTFRLILPKKSELEEKERKKDKGDKKEETMKRKEWSLMPWILFPLSPFFLYKRPGKEAGEGEEAEHWQLYSHTPPSTT